MLAIAALTAGGCGVPKEARQYRAAGIVKMQNGDYNGAAESLEAAYKQAGHFSGAFEKDVLKYLGEAEYNKGDYAKAVETFNELIRRDGSKAVYLYFRSAANAENNDIDAARKDFDEARKKDRNAKTPGADLALAAIAHNLEESGDYDTLGSLAEGLIGDGWTNPEVYNVLGICAAEAGDYEKAGSDFDDALKACGDDTTSEVAGEIRLNQGTLAEKQGDFESALSIYREVLSTWGGDADLKKEILFLKSRVGDTTEDDFSKIVEETTEAASEGKSVESGESKENSSKAESSGAAKESSSADRESTSKTETKKETKAESTTKASG